MFCRIQQLSRMMPRCNFCCLQSDNLCRCTGCFSVRYCSRRCQKKDWKRGHRSFCKQHMRERLPHDSKENMEPLYRSDSNTLKKVSAKKPMPKTTKRRFPLYTQDEICQDKYRKSHARRHNNANDDDVDDVITTDGYRRDWPAWALPRGLMYRASPF